MCGVFNSCCSRREELKDLRRQMVEIEKSLKEQVGLSSLLCVFVPFVHVLFITPELTEGMQQ